MSKSDNDDREIAIIELMQLKWAVVELQRKANKIGKALTGIKFTNKYQESARDYLIHCSGGIAIDHYGGLLDAIGYLRDTRTPEEIDQNEPRQY